MCPASRTRARAVSAPTIHPRSRLPRVDSPLLRSPRPCDSPRRHRSRGNSTPYVTPEASPTRKQETRACTFRLRRVWTRRTLPLERERAHDARCTIRVVEHDLEPRKDRARASEGRDDVRCTLSTSQRLRTMYGHTTREASVRRRCRDVCGIAALALRAIWVGTSSPRAWG
ncbi:hypothetical protein B0H19DRAFT_601995 [Mycena capillaripes]|nr:hypothetical protein B0H19DRAFT_601995 [Mycena capillaripes]